MDLSNIPLNQPIEPYINEDGYYTQCRRCYEDIDSHNNICPYCHQLQDWSWLNKKP